MNALQTNTPVRRKTLRPVRVLFLCLAGLMLWTLGTACFGRFPATQAVWRLNRSITSFKFVHTLVFWLFLIIPVYEIAFLIDAIVINLIEFWFGEPLQTAVHQENDDGTTVALLPTEEEHVVRLVHYDVDGSILSTHSFVRLEGGDVEVYAGDGTLAGGVAPNGAGGLDLLDNAGTVVASLSAGDIRELREATGRLRPEAGGQ